jgi:amino acid transporter
LIVLFPFIFRETSCANLHSVDGFALQFLSVIVISRDGNWTPSNGVIYAVFIATVACHAVIASTLAGIMGRLQSVFVVLNFVLILATIIALPVGQKDRNSASYIFTHTENLTAWPTGWTFMLSWLSPIWTIGGFDSAGKYFAVSASQASDHVRLSSYLRGSCQCYKSRAFGNPLLNWFLLAFRLDMLHCHRGLYVTRS